MCREVLNYGCGVDLCRSEVELYWGEMCRRGRGLCLGEWNVVKSAGRLKGKTYVIV